MKQFFIWVILTISLMACSGEPEATPTAERVVEQPTSTTQFEPTHTATPVPPSPMATRAATAIASPTLLLPTLTPQPTPKPTARATPEPFNGAKLPKAEGVLFSGSGVCQICHTNLEDEAGSNVSIDAFWRSTMMANAARDPYWLASVKSEVLELPELQPVIEDTCASCHMPMGHFTNNVAGENNQIFDDGLLNSEDDLAALAMDGVSCTLCHQVEANNFGQEESFNGGFSIDTQLPVGERRNYGPFDVSAEDVDTMQSASGFIPIQGEHIEQSELCATCHTLYTPIFDNGGQVVGQFPEQMAYLEWLNSDFAEVAACQDCHMPLADGPVVISGLSETPREPFHKHVFVGGNAYVLEMFRAFGPDLNVTAGSNYFEATIMRTLDQLGQQTAELDILEATVENGQLAIALGISSQVGHKFPTGFPSRRTWLHLTVQDGSGAVLFESGATNPDGSIAGNDNDESALAYEPHYDMISSSDQVQIYEALPIDLDGDLTTVLLHSAGYAKDNRLLPAGFSKEAAPGDVGVYGEADNDANFDSGGDIIQYVVDVSQANGLVTISAELLFQSIGYRWAENLHHHPAPEVTIFLEYYESVPNNPVVVAKAMSEVSP